MISLSLIALGVAASLWAAVELAKEVNARDCRDHAKQVYQLQLDTIKKQARLQGTFTSELEKAFEQVAKGTLAASTACISETPNIRFTEQFIS